MRTKLHAGYAPVAVAVAIAIVVFAGSLVQAKAYWFESYQRAVRLIDTGKAAEASTILSEIALEQPQPLVSFRIPGSQFIDYLPYYQQARAQFELGQFEAATENLAISETYGALTESRRHLKGYAELQSKLHGIKSGRRTGNSGFTAAARH